MGISKAADYAILAVGYLATSAKSSGVDIRSKSELVESLSLPREFLSQILQKLVRANILSSTRGARGGYSLRRPASETTFLDVIEAIDGRSKMVECLAEDYDDCGRLPVCHSIVSKMAYLQGEIESLLASVTFQDISVSEALNPAGVPRE
ncbi:MAG: Rrf2 family transcriptional regulator [Candidatus Neomarinimicrobiota bacterium]